MILLELMLLPSKLVGSFEEGVVGTSAGMGVGVSVSVGGCGRIILW